MVYRKMQYCGASTQGCDYNYACYNAGDVQAITTALLQIKDNECLTILIDMIQCLMLKLIE